MKIFQKIEKLNFYPKFTKIGVLKKVDHRPNNSRNYRTAYYQTLDKVPGPLVPAKNSKT